MFWCSRAWTWIKRYGLWVAYFFFLSGGTNTGGEFSWFSAPLFAFGYWFILDHTYDRGYQRGLMAANAAKLLKELPCEHRR